MKAERFSARTQQIPIRTPYAVPPETACRNAGKQAVSADAKTHHGLTAGAAVLLALFFLWQPERCSLGALAGLSLCAKAVIPALFPFLCMAPILSEFLSEVLSRHTGKQNTGNRTAASALISSFVIGILTGFPIGAVALASHCQSGRLDKKTASHFLGVCTASSPAFLSGYIGKTLFGSAAIGWFLYAEQISVLGLIFLIQFKNTINTAGPCAAVLSSANKSEPHAYTSISAAIRRGAENMLGLCGAVVFFSVIRALVCAFCPHFMASCIGGILEMTGGTLEVSKLYESGILTKQAAVILTSGMIGFGGICVGMQTAGCVQNTALSMREYWVQKVIIGILCAAVTALSCLFL